MLRRPALNPVTGSRRYAVAPGLRWAAFDDGTVVYVGTTCETHALAPEFSALLGAPGDAVVIGADEVDADAAAEAAIVIPAALAEQLAQLKILRALH